MRTALDLPYDALDEHERSFVSKIRKHGWHGTGVFAENDLPGFNYTSGFWLSAGAPEVIVFELNSENAHDLLWSIFTEAKAGRHPKPKSRLNTILENLPVFFFPVAKRHYATHLGWDRWLYGGDDFPCLQLVWPDGNGVMPWEAGFNDKLLFAQPDVTESGWLAELAN